MRAQLPINAPDGVKAEPGGQRQSFRLCRVALPVPPGGSLPPGAPSPELRAGRLAFANDISVRGDVSRLDEGGGMGQTEARAHVRPTDSRDRQRRAPFQPPPAAVISSAIPSKSSRMRTDQIATAAISSRSIRRRSRSPIAPTFGVASVPSTWRTKLRAPRFQSLDGSPRRDGLGSGCRPGLAGGLRRVPERGPAPQFRQRVPSAGERGPLSR
jgi:hypothetical protein